MDNNVPPLFVENGAENDVKEEANIEINSVVSLAIENDNKKVWNGDESYIIDPLVIQSNTEDELKEESFLQECPIEVDNSTNIEETEDFLFSDVTGHNVTFLTFKSDSPPSSHPPPPPIDSSESSCVNRLLGHEKRVLRVVLQRCQLDNDGKPIRPMDCSENKAQSRDSKKDVKLKLKNTVKTVRLLPASKRKKHFVSLTNIKEEVDSEIEDKKPIRKWKPGKYTYIPKRKGKKKNSTKIKKENVCKWCGNDFKKFSKLLRHQETQRSIKNLQCPFCYKSFDHKCVMTKHLECDHNAEDKKFACKDCSMKFPSKSALRRHKFTHTEMFPFECPECQKRFRRKDHVTAHMHSVHPKDFGHICTICEEGFKDKHKLAIHMTWTHNYEGYLKCPHCPHSLNSKSGMKRHIATHSDTRDFVCPETECGMAFYTPKDLKRHSAKHETVTPFNCNYCDRKFKTKNHVYKHLGRSKCRNKLPYQCTLKGSCRRGFRTIERLRAHEIAHAGRKRLKCDVEGCLKFFRVKTNLVNHKESVHGLKSPPELGIASENKETLLESIQKRQLVVCLQRIQLGKANPKYIQPKWFKYFKGYCYLKKCVVKDTWYWRCSELQTLKCQATLIEHLITGEMKRGLRKHNHPPDAKKKLSDNPISEAEVPTTRRNKVKNGDAKVGIVSLDKITGESIDGFFTVKAMKRKIHQCPHCEKSFRKKSVWVIHVRTHTGEKPFVCPFCDKKFSTNGILTTHKLLHTNERPFKCSDCNYRGLTSTNLKSHVLTNHTPNRPRPFKCDQCEKAFTTKDILTLHLRTHTGEKPFRCDVCQKCFAQHGGLVNHKRTHSNERPYTCTSCDFDCATSSGLRTHEKLMHSETKIYYQCRNCPRRFTSYGNIKGHCIRIHFASSVDFCEEDYYLI